MKHHGNRPCTPSIQTQETAGKIKKKKNKGSQKAFASHDQENCSCSGSNFGNSGFGASRFTCTDQLVLDSPGRGKQESGYRGGHQEVTERAQSRPWKGKRRPRDSESSFISPNSAVSGEGPDRPGRWRTAYLGHAAVGRSEPELREERERERRSQEPWSPSPERVPRHPTPSVEEPLPGPRPLTRTIERRLRTRRGPMHTPRYRAVLRGSVQRKRPGQPSPTLPRHATPLLRPHTHQGPAPSYEAPQALPCPSHLAAPLTTILSLRHPRPHQGHVPKSQVRPRPLAGPRPATSSVLPRLRGARLVHVHPPLCWTRFGSHGSGWGWRAGDCHIASHSIFHRTLSKEQ